MRYKPHQSFITAAKLRSAIWQTGLGMVAIFLIYVMAVTVFFQTLANMGDGSLPDQVVVGSTKTGVLLILGSFGFLLAATVFVTLVWHRRSAASLFGPISYAARDFWRVIKALSVLYVLLLLIPGESPTRVYAFSTWLLLLPLALPLLLLQVATEEIVFRGYLQQQFAARFSHPLVWMVLPSAIFGVLHYAPEDYAGNAGYIALWAFFFGLITADLTARTGTLGAAVAVHFATNTIALLVISPTGPLSALALYLLPFSASDEAAVAALLPLDFMVMLISWLTARIALRV